MFVVIYMNKFCWPEVVGTTSTDTEARELVKKHAKLLGRPTLVHDGNVFAEPDKDGVSNVSQEQFRTGHESYHSFLIQQSPPAL